jgi:hypothetical protein
MNTTKRKNNDNCLKKTDATNWTVYFSSSKGMFIHASNTTSVYGLCFFWTYIYEKETPLRLFNTRKRKGCFREQEDTQIKIYTIPMNNGGMMEPMVLTSEPLSRLDQHSDLNHPRPLPSTISGNVCEEGGGGVSKLYSAIGHSSDEML